MHRGSERDRAEPSDTVSTRLPVVSPFRGGEVVVLVRRLIITAVLAGFGYSVFSTAGKGVCLGGVGADGSFTDRFGNATDTAPSCINMTLGPSPVVYLVLGLILVWAATGVQRAKDEVAALRILSWTGPAVVAVVVLAVVVAHAAFFSIPLESWDGVGIPAIPGWLSVDVVISPMQSQL